MLKRLDPYKVQRIFEENLQKVKELSNGWYIALCPFHGDEHHSFSFNPEIGYAQCFACGWKGNLKKFLLDLGYEEKEVRKILKSCFTDFDGEVKINRPTQVNKVKTQRVEPKKKEKLPPPWEIYEKKTVYIYRLPDGTPIMKKYRYENPKPEYEGKVNKKTFIIKWLVEEKKSVFYGMETLPKMGTTPKGNKVVFWAEGEKCVEALKKRSKGFGTLGFQNIEVEWRNSLKEIFPYIRGAIHIIFADNDQVGRYKAEYLAERLKEIGIEKIYIVDFGEERPPKWDIADEVKQGSLKEAIKKFKKLYHSHPQARV